MRPDDLRELMDRLPAPLRAAFARGDRDGFDRALRASELFDPGPAAALDAAAAAHGLGARPPSRFDALQQLARRRLAGEGEGPAG